MWYVEHNCGSRGSNHQCCFQLFKLMIICSAALNLSLCSANLLCEAHHKFLNMVVILVHASLRFWNECQRTQKLYVLCVKQTFVCLFVMLVNCAKHCLSTNCNNLGLVEKPDYSSFRQVKTFSMIPRQKTGPEPHQSKLFFICEVLMLEIQKFQKLYRRNCSELRALAN